MVLGEMIRIGICEDIAEELDNHRHIVQSVMTKLSVNADLFCFQSGEDLLCEIDATGNMDIILLDIEMVGMNGLETARIIRDKDTRAVLIFISSYDQYCKSLIEVQPFAYMDKPVCENKLGEILQYALQTRFDLSESYSFSYHKMQYNIPLADIRYFQSDKRIIYVNTSRRSMPEQEYLFYGKMEKVEETIKKSSMKFLRVRKSFLINPQFITEYGANKVVLDDGMIVEISKNYRDAVKQYYVSVLRGKKWE